MTLWVYFVCSIFVMVSGAPRKIFYDLEEAETHFQQFVETFKKEYQNEFEKARRLEIFRQTLERINKQNRESKLAVFGINQFSDLTTEEFRNKHLCMRMNSNETLSVCKEKLPSRNVNVPDAFSWVDQGKVSNVKNQKHCGSCWAFSTVGSLEGAYAIQTGQLLEFSEQQLVDCDTTSDGCEGGFPAQAIQYLQQSGAMEETVYPYTAAQGSCQFDASKVKAKVAGCQNHKTGSEEELMSVLVNTGPLSIGICGDSLSDYHGGIYEDCKQGVLNHAVLLVGYGTENNTPYWIIKNSYGSSWGEQGYLKVPRNVNACSMMDGSIVSPQIA